MDKQTAKEILSAYRANGSDASDENFDEALSLCRSDPEMNYWLKTETDFDSTFTKAIADIPAPTEGKSSLLATVSFETERPRSRKALFGWWSISIAAAAVITLSLMGPSILKTNTASIQEQIAGVDFMQSLQVLSDQALPLDQISDNLPRLQDWLAQHGAPPAAQLPASLVAKAKLAGCRSFEIGGGQKASLICFTSDGELVHLFTFEGIRNMGQSIPERTWKKRGDWNLYAWIEGTTVMAIASELPVNTLESLIGEA